MVFQKIQKTFSWTKLSVEKAFWNKNKKSDSFSRSKCVICNFLLVVAAPYGPKEGKSESCYDFVIRKEHKFLRNIYDRKVLAESKSLKYLGNFYASFQAFVKVSLLLYDCYDATSIDIQNREISYFCKNYCSKCEDFEEIFKEILKVNIKNNCRKYPVRIIRQIMAFLYMKIMKFLSTQFFILNILKNIFFESVNNIMCGKDHRHHSDITGKIYGDVHSFWNLKVREDKEFFPFLCTACLFSTLFLCQILCVQWANDLSIGGNNLTNLDYVKICEQVKFMDE